MAMTIASAKKRLTKAQANLSDNGKILATLTGGVAAYAGLVTVLDTAVGLAAPGKYAGFAKSLYKDDAGLVISSGALYLALLEMNKEAKSRGWLKPKSKGRADTAAAAFVFARTLYNLDAGNIGTRMEFASAGSLPAAVDPYGPAARQLTAGA